MADERWLLIELNRQIFSIPCMQVIELLEQSAMKVSQMPGCQPPWIGVFKHRETVLPVLDARSMFGFPTFEQELSELREILTAREEDHVSWLMELKSCCETGREFTKATDPHKCAFGKWYDALRASEASMQNLTGDDPSLKMLIDNFDAPHKAIHGIAQEALALAGSGDKEAAERLIEQTWEGELGKMKSLFKSLIEGLVARRKSRYVVMDIAGRHVALMVDEVRSLVTVDTSEIKPAESGEMGEACLKGVYLFEDLGPVMVLDVDAIGEMVGVHKALTGESGAAAA